MEATSQPISSQNLLQHYQQVRRVTESLCEPLQPEDYVLQSMTEASPPKWHLAHTTWFFETFILQNHHAGYVPHHPEFQFLFNSYYDSVGERIARSQRGLISRPGVQQVLDYRQAVDEQIVHLLEQEEQPGEEVASLLTVGLHHEQQHQELLLTDLKHAFSHNPLFPTYRPCEPFRVHGRSELTWKSYEAGVREIGHEGEGFAYDNEAPRHRVFLEPFEISSRLVTVSEYLDFMEAGGYHSSQYWLSDGWQIRCQLNWEAPLYWTRQSGEWEIFTLGGLRELYPEEPIAHVSYYEADAYARWAEGRLPTEAEWRALTDDSPRTGNFLETGALHPLASRNPSAPQTMGDAWEWTGSPYVPYPGYRPWSGSLGEYNGKFMCNQMVLRGGSCVTPQTHVRPSYRNFFPPEARWQFSGFRLARSQ